MGCSVSFGVFGECATLTNFLVNCNAISTRVHQERLKMTSQKTEKIFPLPGFTLVLCNSYSFHDHTKVALDCDRYLGG